MKFLEYKKINEKVSDKKDLDPFDEEDWDEIDGHYSIFKIRVGATSKEVKLLCFPTHIQNVEGKVFIKDDRFKTIYKNKEHRFEESVIQGIGASNCFIIDEKDYRLSNIINYIKHYIESREKSCESNIKTYNKMLSGEYERDEDDEPVDEYKTIEKLRLDKILLQNIIEFKKGLEFNIKILIKINDF